MIVTILAHEEGFRNKPYLCSEGYVTVGFGTKLHSRKGMLPSEFPLDLDRASARVLMENDINKLHQKLVDSNVSSTYLCIPNDCRAVIQSMAYQLGVRGLLKFRKMWAALSKGDWHEASVQALDSRWAKQTPARAKRHARILAGETALQVYCPPHDNSVK